MPGLARKILICAAVDGLIIQPLSSRGQRPVQPVRIKYGDATISAAPWDQTPDAQDSFEAYGVIGLITVSKLSYLITITRRQQVAQIFGSPIYVVTEVALTPCSQKSEAEDSIKKTALHLQDPNTSNPASDDDSRSDEEMERPSIASDDVDDAVAIEETKKDDSATSSIVADVIHKRGSYGRFAQRWFSRSGWTQDQQRTMGISNSTPSKTTATEAAAKTDVPSGGDSVEPSTIPLGMNQVSYLLPKLLRTMQILFGSSRSFYFAYDFDLTHSLDKIAPLSGEGQLHSKVDSDFFWNQHILKPFLKVGQDALALPIMQGFVGQRTFTVDSNPPQADEKGEESLELHSLSSEKKDPSQPEAVDQASEEPPKLRTSEQSYLITVISRRSVQRAGLRYLRRGINQDGFTANSVETEQILSRPDWSESSAIYSFLQIRGSIPLFFTQTPYSLKPVPILQHSEETNRQACQKHFDRLRKKYGSIQIVNLIEKHGIEAPIGKRYEQTISYLNDADTRGHDVNQNLNAQEPLAWEWFDFHQACRGMKFENVSYLLSTMKEKLDIAGSTRRKDGKILQIQKGIIRTNCMDCLDRTNVCQSSFAKHMLDAQLSAEGIDMSAQLDQENRWFNMLWADNGDAVSKQYASTAAMKGDYTRTRKRDYRGALNDLGLSLTRFYSGMVNDYFSQAAIDFLLGNVNDKVFDEFETNMATKDPAISIEQVRSRAIDLCSKRIIADETEEYMGGWILLSPRASNTVKSSPMEEVVLLLTDLAIYLCRFDWNLEKVSSFERVHLASITNIKVGTYITSTMSTLQTDETRNYGFLVTFKPGETDIKRTNTRTLSSHEEHASSTDPKNGKHTNRPMSLTGMFSGGAKPSSTLKRLAFKAPYAYSSASTAGEGTQLTETQQITSICSDIDRLVVQHHSLKKTEPPSVLEQESIISLEEAKMNTGVLDHLGHSIKKLVWA